MRVTIIPSDGAVIVDGERYIVDCSGLPGVHAVQWDGTGGEVEYDMTRCAHCGARSKKGNSIISDLTPYQPYVDAWKAAKVIADQARAAAAETLRLAQEEAIANAARPQA